MDNRKQDWFREVKSILCQYETKYQILKEATSVIELALWKMELNDQSKKGRHNKKMKIDESDHRGQSRFSCGADIVVQHVLPYLVPV